MATAITSVTRMATIQPEPRVGSRVKTGCWLCEGGSWEGGNCDGGGTDAGWAGRSSKCGGKSCPPFGEEGGLAGLGVWA